MQESTAVRDDMPEDKSGGNGAPPERDKRLARALMFVGLAAVSAGVAYALIRAALSRQTADDPTAERIASLIEEANRLLKELDEKKPG